MSISEEIIHAHKGLVDTVKVNKESDLNGQRAVEVTVNLTNGKQVVGTFTTESKDSFGGVQFSSQKDIPALMISKINSVLKGTAERG